MLAIMGLKSERIHMLDFTQSLLLSYLKHKSDNYSISEVLSEFGMCIEQLFEHVDELRAKKWVEYDEESMLKITKTGLQELANSDADYYDLSDVDISLANIYPDKAWPIDRPYVPKK